MILGGVAVLSLTHQTLLLRIRVSLDWTLCANQCWAIIIQHCCCVIDYRRRGGLVINSSNFTSLGHNFGSYHGIVSFFPFPQYFLCQINFGGYPGMDKYSIRWGDTTPKFLSGIIISPLGNQLKSYPKLSFLKLNLLGILDVFS